MISLYNTDKKELRVSGLSLCFLVDVIVNEVVKEFDLELDAVDSFIIDEDDDSQFWDIIFKCDRAMAYDIIAFIKTGNLL